MIEDRTKGLTFDVQNVTLGKRKSFVNGGDLRKLWKEQGKAVEAMSPCPENAYMLFDKNHLFARVVHTSFYEHYPLILTPDVIWVTIAQGFANHVNENSEALRSMFVDFEGKETIEVTMNEFVKGSPNNDWESVFPAFAQGIAQHIGSDKLNLLQSDFSTTTTVSKVVSQIVLMDTVQSYFDYVMFFGCGFPSITLKGTVQDWCSIRDRAQALEKYKLGWWTKTLVKVLDEFVEAAKGNANIKFWKSMVNKMGGSGFKSPMSGWIQAFFPYILSGKGTQLMKNKYLSEYEKYLGMEEESVTFEGWGDNGLGLGLKLERIPSSISSAPFTCIDLTASLPVSYPMLFMGGLVAAVQHEDKSIEPTFGWAVLELQQA